jgi:hypothetical protein
MDLLSSVQFSQSSRTQSHKTMELPLLLLNQLRWLDHCARPKARMR